MDTLNAIREIIHDVSGVPLESIELVSTAEELRLDSLDITEVVLNVEELLDVLVEDESTIRTVADLVECVNSQLQVA